MIKNSFLLMLVVLTLYNCKKDRSNLSNIAELEESTNSIELILNEKVPLWQNELKIPDVGIGIIEGGEIIFSKVYSLSDYSLNTSDNLIFNIASVTKVVFGTTVMKLVTNGDWDLDEPLYKFYIDSDIKDDPRHKILTSRHILSQQSGFVNWRWNHPTGKLTFDFDPGTKFNYSGEGMEYLRKSIEKKFNKDWGEIADSILFKPLQMNSTFHSWDGKTDFDNFSRFYDSKGKEHIIEDHSFTSQAADDLMTTVSDLSLFGIDVINGAGLSKKHFEEMVKSHASISPNQNQALSWRVIENLKGGEYAIHHGGNDIGVATLLVLLPESKRGVVVFTNGDGGLLMCNNVVRTVFEEGKEIIYRAYRGTPLDEMPEVTDVTKKVLEQYVGTYVQPSGREVNITTGDNKLVMEMAGVPDLQFFPESDTLFFLMDFDPKILFSKDQEGNGTLSILEGENTIICTKKLKN